LWDYFETGGFADDHEDRNRIAAAARDRAGAKLGVELSGDEIVVVGDTPLDIECARAIGARCLAVATGGFTSAQLKTHQPAWLVENLQAVEAAEICR
jgi:phosphoglycolate phosphatase-like HAD superfamily hydrolase